MNGEQEPAKRPEEHPWETKMSSNIPQQAHSAPPPIAPAGDITWTASEFIAHKKDARWYLILAGSLAALCVIVFFLFHDYLTIAAIIIMGSIFGYAASREPQIQKYSLNARHITVGQRSYPLSAFRAFSLVREGAFTSIVFWPMKQLGVPVGIYYAPEDEDAIVDLVSKQLPIIHHEPTKFEILVRAIRF